MENNQNFSQEVERKVFCGHGMKQENQLRERNFVLVESQEYFILDHPSLLPNNSHRITEEIKACREDPRKMALRQLTQSSYLSQPSDSSNNENHNNNNAISSTNLMKESQKRENRNGMINRNKSKAESQCSKTFQSQGRKKTNAGKGKGNKTKSSQVSKDIDIKQYLLRKDEEEAKKKGIIEEEEEGIMGGAGYHPGMH